MNDQPIYEKIEEKWIKEYPEYFLWLADLKNPLKRAQYCNMRQEDSKDTPCGLLLQHPLLLSPNSPQYKVLRQCFRLPPPPFLIYGRLMQGSNMFQSVYDCAKIPFEIKVLIRSSILDGIIFQMTWRNFLWYRSRQFTH